MTKNDTNRSGTNHSLYRGCSGVLHVGAGDLVFHEDLSERPKMLCGTFLKPRPGQDVNGHILADSYRDGSLCTGCLDKLRERGSCIPGFIKNGELVPPVARTETPDRDSTDTDQ